MLCWRIALCGQGSALIMKHQFNTMMPRKLLMPLKGATLPAPMRLFCSLLMTLCTPYLVLFLVALFFFTNPVSAQSVTFRTVRECVNYQYDLVVKNLCTSSNQCNVNLCSSEYKSSDSYNQIVNHCETVMLASPSVVEPLMQARCDQGRNHASSKKRIGTIVGATIGGLAVLGIVGTIAWHIFVREVPLLTRMGMSSPFTTIQPARTLSHRDGPRGARHVRRSQNGFMPSRESNDVVSPQ